ncbi:MAG: hypothetical protein IT337_04580 [Thermomicrobiales bacterium]|nr:hypothetical protein [Thermomicrobiales bacterium]
MTKQLPHVFLAGGGATRFACEATLITPLASRYPEHPYDVHVAVNAIARGRQGNPAGRVSTSGWAWKYPQPAG